MPRPRVSPLGHRDFRLFYTGRIASDLGTAAAPVAVTFAVLALGGGASRVGIVLASEIVPLVLLLLPGGVLADRIGPRAALLGADALCFGAQGVLAAWLLLGHPGVAVFMVCAALVGTGWALAGPALTAMLPALVPGEALQPGNALVSVSDSVGQVIGPAVGGLLVATVGPGWAIGLDAASYLVSFGCLVLVRSGRPPVGSGAAERSHPVAELVAGWREFVARTWLWVIVVQFSIWSMLVYAPVMVLGAVQAQDRGAGARTWGLVLAALGVGATLAGLVITRWRPARPLVTGTMSMLAWTLPPLLLAMHAPFLVIGAATALAGVAFGIFGPLWQTTVQREVPPDILSRVSAYDYFGSVALLPVGYALAGPLAAMLGAGNTLLLAAVANLVLVPVVLAVPSVRSIRAVPVPVAASP